MSRWNSLTATPRLSPAGSDRALGLVLTLFALLSASVLVLIVLFVLRESLPSLTALGARFWSDDSWHPAAQAASGSFGLLPIVAGTLLTTSGALLLAAPLGLLSAIFLHFYAPAPLAGPYRRFVQLMAGIPSVVYGLWGLVALVPLIARLHPPGPSLLAGSIVLAVMILPTVALLSDAALASVPAGHLRGASALGLARWSTIRRVALPAARSGITAALLLSLGRALGETMAVLMVAGNVVSLPQSIFDPVRTLTANIALEMAYATGDHRSALFASGLLLLGVVGLLVFTADSVAERTRRSARG